MKNSTNKLKNVFKLGDLVKPTNVLKERYIGFFLTMISEKISNRDCKIFWIEKRTNEMFVGKYFTSSLEKIMKRNDFTTL